MNFSTLYRISVITEQYAKLSQQKKQNKYFKTGTITFKDRLIW